MDSFNKREGDFQKGKNNINQVIKNLNEYFLKEGVELSIEKIHSELKTMKIFEKAKNNTIQNRINKAPFTKAMGLDCVVKNGEKNRELPLFVRYADDFGFYIKLPKEIKTKAEVETYLKVIVHYSVLFVFRHEGKISSKYCGPMPLKNIIKYCHYSKAESKGNKNRLQFEYNPSKLVYLFPEEASLFDGDLLTRIKGAME